MLREHQTMLREIRNELNGAAMQEGLKYKFQVKLEDSVYSNPKAEVYYRSIYFDSISELLYGLNPDKFTLMALMIDELYDRLGGRIEIINKKLLEEDDLVEGKLPISLSDLKSLTISQSKFQNKKEKVTEVVDMIEKDYEILYALKRSEVNNILVGKHYRLAYNNCEYYIADSHWVYNKTKGYVVPNHEEKEAVLAKLELFHTN